MEFQTGRQEMMQNFTRGLGLLEEAEFSARRDAEQMARAMSDLREALTKVEAIRQESWTEDNFDVELTRSLTTLENARMEWNSARLKFPLLSGSAAVGNVEAAAGAQPPEPILGARNLGELCRLGLALTWPLAATGLLVAAALVLLLLRR
jgi:DNA repair ATPase RecN